MFSTYFYFYININDDDDDEDRNNNGEYHSFSVFCAKARYLCIFCVHVKCIKLILDAEIF